MLDMSSEFAQIDWLHLLLGRLGHSSLELAQLLVLLHFDQFGLVLSQLVFEDFVNDFMPGNQVHVIMEQMLVILLVDVQVQETWGTVEFLEMALVTDDVRWRFSFSCSWGNWPAAGLSGASASLGIGASPFL